MGFGNAALSVVTAGLRWATGSFAERLVSSGYIGDIATAPSMVLVKCGSVYMCLELVM